MFSYLFPKQYGVEDLFVFAKDSEEDLFLSALSAVKSKTRIEDLLALDSREWTLAQYLATNGLSRALTELLIYCRANISEEILLQGLSIEGAAGHSPLMMAAINRHEDVVCLLLNYGCTFECVTSRERNCIYILARNNMTTAAELIWNTRSHDVFTTMGNKRDTNGYTALHAAALMGNSTMCELLISCGVGEVGRRTLDGSNALHIACRLNANQPSAEKSSRVVRVLLAHWQSSRSPEDVLSLLREADTFGSTPLHIAVSCGNDLGLGEILGAVVVSADDIVAQDNDGYHPTHIACHTIGRLAEELSRLEEAEGETRGELEQKRSASLRTLRLLAGAGYPLSATDFADCTVLHALAGFAPLVAHDQDLSSALDLVLEQGGERLVAVENSSGWTCLHMALATEMSPADSSAFSSRVRAVASESFLASFDADKAKKTEVIPSRLRCGAHNRIPVEERRAILEGEYTTAGVCHYLKTLPHTPRVVVVTGAGISTSAGIKDFRSQDGLYANASTSQLFSMEFLSEQPVAFFSQVKELFLPVIEGSVKPTKAHALLRLLSDEGWLSRVYTQNIDMLEQRVGLEEHQVVECHGSFNRAYCTNEECERAGVRIDSPAEMERLFWGPIGDDPMLRCPHCETCGALLRPDVTFFGEPLPARFGAAAMQDLPDCDLVLVMGTSLVVYPVASLPQMAPPKAVRMLINREATGCFQFVKDSAGAKKALVEGEARFQPWETSQYRDVFRQGDCDAGAEEFADALGKRHEFETIVQTYC